MITFDTADLIRMSGETARIIRPVVKDAGSFAGPHSETENVIADVPIEFQSLSPTEQKQIGADGLCNLLPETDVKDGDLVIFGGVRFVVTDVRPENCFGAVTHLTVRLEREYKALP